MSDARDVPDRNECVAVGKVVRKGGLRWTKKTNKPVINIVIQAPYTYTEKDKEVEATAEIEVAVYGLRAIELDKELEVGSHVSVAGYLYPRERTPKEGRKALVIDGEKVTLEETNLVANTIEVVDESVAQQFSATISGRVIERSRLEWTRKTREPTVRVTLESHYSYRDEDNRESEATAEIHLVAYGESAISMAKLTEGDHIVAKGRPESRRRMLRRGGDVVLISGQTPVMERETTLNVNEFEVSPSVAGSEEPAAAPSSQSTE